MTATHDKFGRPIVVVTGMGVVTSLGAGKADNWAKLTAGKSGIRTITRFPTDGLKTTMAGAVDFIPVEPFSSTDLSERLGELAAEEAIAQSGIGTQGRFSRAAVPRGRPRRSRVAAAPGAWPRDRLADRNRLRRHAARSAGGGQLHAPITGAFCSAPSPTISPKRSAPRARRSRCRPPAPPARPRSSSASKRSGAARPTPRFASPPTARSIQKP